MGFDLLRATKCSVMNKLSLSFWNLTFWIAPCMWDIGNVFCNIYDIKQFQTYFRNSEANVAYMDLNNLLLVPGCRTCLISFSSRGGVIQGNMWNGWSSMDWQPLLPSGRPFAWASVLIGAHQPLLCGMLVAPLEGPCAGTAHQSLTLWTGAIKCSAGLISAQLFTSEMSNLSEIKVKL